MSDAGSSTSGGTRWTLAIEASNPSAAQLSAAGESHSGPGVAAGVRGEGGGVTVLGAEGLRPTGRHDDDLMPAIDRLCARLGLSPSRLERVIVSIGPGGFTGIRVAIATAKALAITTGSLATGVPTARVAAMAVAGSRRPCAVLLASTRTGPEPSAWVEVFEDGSEPVHAGVVTASGLASLCKTHGVRTIAADGQLPDALRPAEVDGGVGVVPLSLDAAACLRVGWGLPAVAAAGVLPLYGREPEAVRRWRELHGAAPGD